MTFLQITHYSFDIFFAFWPVVLASGFKNPKHVLVNMLALWVILAFARAFLFFSPEPIAFGGFFFPDPQSTIWFFVAGAVLLFLKTLTGTLSKRAKN